MPPRALLCCMLYRTRVGALGGNGSGFARAIKGFPFFGFFRAKKRLAAKAQCPYLLSLFPCKGGQVGACGSFIISLVSFFVIASKKFQARNLCFAFRLWCQPNGWGALLLAKLAPTHFGARFARPIKLLVSLRSTNFQFFFHKSKKKNLIPIK